MTYTVQLDFWIDGENDISTDEQISDILKELINGAFYGIENIKVVDVND